MIDTKERLEFPATDTAVGLRGDRTTARPHRKGFWMGAAAIMVVAGIAAALLITRPGPLAPEAPASVDTSTVAQREQAFRSGLRELQGGTSVDLSDQAFRYGLVQLEDWSRVDLSDQAFRYGLVQLEDWSKVDRSDDAFRHPYAPSAGAGDPTRGLVNRGLVPAQSLDEEPTPTERLINQGLTPR